MMRAASLSSQSCRRYPSRAGTAIMQQSHQLLLQQQQKKRSYIFLPASFQELQQVVSDAWASRKQMRRTVLVKLWQRRPARQKRFLIKKWIPKSSFIRHIKQYEHHRYLFSKRRFLNVKRLFRERAQAPFRDAKNKMGRYLERRRQQWKSLRVTVTEPVESNWFDADGYPKAVQNSFGRFVNPWSSQSTNGMHSTWNFMKWRMERLYNTFLGNSYRGLLPCTSVPDSKPDLDFQRTLPPVDQIRVTWLGHATTLVEMHGFTVLTDPMFSKRTGPGFFGVTRHVDPPCLPQDLPGTIDVCVISHDHYDHLDYSSVMQLRDKVSYWAVPLGISDWLQVTCEIDKSRVLEMTWWQSTMVKRDSEGDLQVVYHEDPKDLDSSHVLKLVCAPSQHWCGRTMWDRNQRLWCSWVVQAGSLKFFFAGDTALPDKFPLHRQIGDRLGPFNVAALPIGAYSPSYFMKTSHVHPAEAVKIHQDLRVQKSVAIHWGTFALAEEAHDEPPQLLEEAARNAQVDFSSILPGSSIVGPEGNRENAFLPQYPRIQTNAEDAFENDNRIEYYG